MTNQTGIVKRTEAICKEFDIRVAEVGIPIARLELAKAFAECEAAQPTVEAEARGDWVCKNCGWENGWRGAYCFKCDALRPA